MGAFCAAATRLQTVNVETGAEGSIPATLVPSRKRRRSSEADDERSVAQRLVETGSELRQVRIEIHYCMESKNRSWHLGSNLFTSLYPKKLLAILSANALDIIL